MTPKEIYFFLLRLGKKSKGNKEIVDTISRVRGDIAPFVQENNSEGLYAFVWETYAQLRIRFHAKQERSLLLQRKLYAKLAQRLEHAC